MSEERTDAAASPPTRRSTQGARPVAPPLPSTDPLTLPERTAAAGPGATPAESVHGAAAVPVVAAPVAAADLAPASAGAFEPQNASRPASDVRGGVQPDSDTRDDIRDETREDIRDETAPTPELAWAPPAPRRPPALAGWALAVAIIGLIVSLVVGWGFPVGIIAIITAIAALRRPGRKRQAAAWALALGILSILYSALWIYVAVSRGPLF